MAKYFADASGKMTEIQPITVSAGAADGSKIAQTDSTGRFDISLMPIGIGREVTVLPTSESLTAGNFVNVYTLAAIATARKADATTNAKPAFGFTLANTTAPASATIYSIGAKNTALLGLIPGADYWLAITPGAATSTAPSTIGNLVQELGTAESATAMVFSNAKFSWTKA